MNRLKQLIHEIHRRSLWQVLGIYLVSGWVVFEVVQTLTEGLGLPAWFPALAMVLLLIGLPVVLATAFVQEGFGPSDGTASSVDDDDGGGPPPAPERVSRETAGPRRFLTWRLALLGGVGAFAVLGVIASAWLLFRARESPTAASAPIGSIAVLPLGNNMGDPAQDYFVDGMTELLTAELAKIGSLIVTSRTSAGQYRNTTKSMPEIARELGVDGLVEGSVLRGGDSILVTVQLIEGATDRHLWADSFRGRLEDAIGLQGRIAAAIAREIQAVLTPAEQDLLARARPVDPAAQEAFLRGEFYMERVYRGEDVLASLPLALEQYRQAVGLAPDWALAHAAEAQTLHWLASLGIDPATNCALSKGASERALELDEAEARAHLARGFALYRCDWSFAEAERENLRAFELSPNAVRWGVALLYKDLARWEDAIQAYRHSIDRSPAWSLLHAQLGSLLVCAGRFQEAEQQLRTLVELDPSQPTAYGALSQALIGLGRPGDAVRAAERAVATASELGAPSVIGYAAYVYARAGDVARAERVLEGALAAGESVPPFAFAAVGRMDRALAMYFDSFERRSDWFRQIQCDPYLDELRENPEIRRMMAAVFPTE